MMVELNFDHDRPEAVVDLTRMPELRSGRPRTVACASGPG